MLLGIGAVVLLVAGGVLADYWSARPLDLQANFVGRDHCIDCHEDQSATFNNSHHDLAMDVATEQTVLGDFDDATLEHDGIVSRMYRDGDRFMVHTEGPSGQMEDFQIKYVFGVDPLQQYMVEFDRTEEMSDSQIERLQVLRISWDAIDQRWFYLDPPDVHEKLEPDDDLHWTGIAQRWQTMCAECHSTDLQRNFDVATGRYHTTFSEIDVSCESCHGPGSLHVELANSTSLFWDRNHGYGLARLKGPDPTAQLETCAPCHSRRGVLDADFHAGEDYFDHYSLETLRRDTYHADGQIKDEVYVLGSFMQSKMYHKGIRCTDCHDPHSLQLKFPGNQACTSCHQHAAGKYDVPSHHHHEPGTQGAQCVSCHMPETTYMEVDPRRDHSLRIPRPDLSVRLGTPNACSRCHVADQLEAIEPPKRELLDEYADWLVAAQQGDEQVAAAIQATDQWCNQACETWYGEERLQPKHFAEPLVAFRRGEPGSIEGLLRMVSVPSDMAPAIARATALMDLSEAGVAEAAKVARDRIRDPDEHPMVRAAAVNVFLNTTPAAAARTLIPLLDDPSRLVRTEATRVLIRSGAYQQALSDAEKSHVDLAAKEVRESLMTASDRGSAHLGWAMLCEQRNHIEQAIKAYETAIRVQPQMVGPRTNLASLLENLANQLASQGPHPQAADLRRRAETLRADELPLLKRDASLAPDNPDVQYRYGLALYLSGDYPAALQQLQKTVELAPDVEIFQTALRLLKEKMQSQ